jgi:hypothetical protein
MPSYPSATMHLTGNRQVDEHRLGVCDTSLTPHSPGKLARATVNVARRSQTHASLPLAPAAAPMWLSGRHGVSMPVVALSNSKQAWHRRLPSKHAYEEQQCACMPCKCANTLCHCVGSDVIAGPSGSTPAALQQLALLSDPCAGHPRTSKWQ